MSSTPYFDFLDTGEIAGALNQSTGDKNLEVSEARKNGTSSCTFARSRAASHDADVPSNAGLFEITGLKRLDLVLQE